MDRKLDDQAALEIFLELCEGLDTPVSLGAWLRFKYASDSCFEQKLKVSDYLEADVDRFAADYLAVSYLKKYETKVKGIDPKEAAILRFRKSEKSNQSQNSLLRKVVAGEACLLPAAHRSIDRIRRKVATILGDVNKIDWSQGTWGPGATTDVRKNAAHLDTKLTKLPISVNRRAFPYLCRVLAVDKGWRDAILAANPKLKDLRSVFSINDVSPLDFATKTVLTHRTILKQNRGESYLQRAVGVHIASRLKKVGIRLDSQETNQILASISMDAGLATLDLEAASDSICKELVHFLLPVDWACLLNDLRMTTWVINGQQHELEMFSSMGNGFTFELETLIFTAIVRVVEEEAGYSPHLSSVFGDDIICHKESVAAVVEVLYSLGFTVNAEKSFTSGLFYESCGKHYFNRQDVTPVYQKERLSKVGSYIRAANRVLKMACRLGRGVRFDLRLLDTWTKIRQLGELDRIRVGPFDLERDDYLMVASREYKRRGSARVHALSNSAKLLPGFDEAYYADWLRRRKSSLNSLFRIRRRPGSLVVDCQIEDGAPYEGFVESRLDKREVLQYRYHRVVATADIDW